MLKSIQSLLIIVLTQIMAISIFALFVIFLNLNLFNQSNFWVSFILHNILIMFTYGLITILINKYFKNGVKLNNKSTILGLLLAIVYLIIFYLSNDDFNFFQYFLLIHFPIGSFFRTIPYTMFDLLIKISVVLSIVSAMLGVYIGQNISKILDKKKKSLSSLSKK